MHSDGLLSLPPPPPLPLPRRLFLAVCKQSVARAVTEQPSSWLRCFCLCLRTKIPSASFSVSTSKLLAMEEGSNIVSSIILLVLPGCFCPCLRTKIASASSSLSTSKLRVMEEGGNTSSRLILLVPPPLYRLVSSRTPTFVILLGS